MKLSLVLLNIMPIINYWQKTKDQPGKSALKAPTKTHDYVDLYRLLKLLLEVQI